MFFPILGQTFRLFFSQPHVVVYHIVLAVVTLIFSTALNSFTVTTGNLAFYLLVSLIGSVIVTWVSLILIVATNHYILKAMAGEPVTLKDGIDRAFSRIQVINRFIGVVAAALTLYLLSVLLFASIPALMCLLIPVLLVALYISVRAILITSVIAAEDHGLMDSYRRSGALISRTLGVLFSAIAAIVVLSFALSFVLLLLFAPQLSELANRGAQAVFSTADLNINPILSAALSAFYSMFGAIFTTVWYKMAADRSNSGQIMINDPVR
jgi:hypothetical protein